VLESPEGEDEESLKQRIVTATARFARRQSSWFKSDPRVGWLEASEEAIRGKVPALLERR
jgi:tRNA A37 N6-isopentenylltransferase MiaA